MAEVYLGRALQPDGRFGPAVAVKRLLPHLNSDPAIVRMFLNEAEITQQIDHPNVVRILDLGNVQAEPFIAMELLEGHSFAELRQTAAQSGRRVPLGVTLRVPRGSGLRLGKRNPGSGGAVVPRLQPRRHRVALSHASAPRRDR